MDFVEGLLLGFSLILPMGPQNLFVLRQGLRGTHTGTAILTATFGDMALIIAGSLGAGQFFASMPLLRNGAKWVGCSFLLVIAYNAFSRWKNVPSELCPVREPVLDKRAVMHRSLLLSFLNPHAILDTVVILGVAGAQYSGKSRIFFATGAIVASLMWFGVLGIGAGRVSAILFRSRDGLRWIDGFTAILLLSSALGIALKV